LQGPFKHLSPAWGQRVGGVSGRPTREAERSNLLARPSSQTVEGTLLHGAPVSFAGRRKNVRLGRSVSRAQWVSSPACGRTGDSGCPLGAEEGNVVGVRQAHALDIGRREKARSPLFEDTSFARSRGPCTSIVTQLFHRKAEGVARSVRYRGRANLRKQEEPAPGSKRTGACAAHRASPLFLFAQEEVVRDALKREDGRGHRPRT